MTSNFVFCFFLFFDYVIGLYKLGLHNSKTDADSEFHYYKTVACFIQLYVVCMIYMLSLNVWINGIVYIRVLIKKYKIQYILDIYKFYVNAVSRLYIFHPCTPVLVPSHPVLYFYPCILNGPIFIFTILHFHSIHAKTDWNWFSCYGSAQLSIREKASLDVELDYFRSTLKKVVRH